MAVIIGTLSIVPSMLAVLWGVGDEFVRRIALVGTAVAIEGFFDFQPEPERAGTRVVATCDLVAHAFLPWLFLRVIARGERKRRIELLPNLKRFVEGLPR